MVRYVRSIAKRGDELGVELCNAFLEGLIGWCCLQFSTSTRYFNLGHSLSVRAGVSLRWALIRDGETIWARWELLRMETFYAEIGSAASLWWRKALTCTAMTMHYYTAKCRKTGSHVPWPPHRHIWIHMTWVKKPAILQLVKLMPAQLIEACSNVLSALQKIYLGSFSLPA